MFKLEFETNNEAFTEYNGGDIEFILLRIATAVRRASLAIQRDDTNAPASGTIRDNNGNTIGKWEYTP